MLDPRRSEYGVNQQWIFLEKTLPLLYFTIFPLWRGPWLLLFPGTMQVTRHFRHAKYGFSTPAPGYSLYYGKV